VVDRSARQAFYFGCCEEAAAAASGSGAGEEASADVGVDGLRLDLQAACNLRGGQVILVTFGRHPTLSNPFASIHIDWINIDNS
jgi:hypothetical protein